MRRSKQLDVHKTCAMTLNGKHPPNRDMELQRTGVMLDKPHPHPTPFPCSLVFGLEADCFLVRLKAS